LGLFNRSSADEFNELVDKAKKPEERELEERRTLSAVYN
jgi:hypothetical protein